MFWENYPLKLSYVMRSDSRDFIGLVTAMKTKSELDVLRNREEAGKMQLVR